MEKTQALLNKKTDRWQIWVCLLGTILLFACAVALVRGAPVSAPPITPPGEVNLVDDPDPVEPPRPAPEETPEASPPPLIQSDVHEENPTPPPMRKRPQVINPSPIPRSSVVGAIGPASLGSVKVLALSAPRPEYPYEARRQRLTGTGVALLLVDPASGAVTDVSIAQDG